MISKRGVDTKQDQHQPAQITTKRGSTVSDDRHLTLADLADELCDPHQHVERIPEWDHNRNRKIRTHRVTMPGLLQQMADLMMPSSSPDGGTSGVPSSRPPATWRALADHTVITLAAAKWCWDLRLDQRDTVEGNIRQLVGASGALPTEDRDRLLADVRRWHRMAQYVTGWKTPPAPVRAPCPALTVRDRVEQMCKARTLRLNYTAGEAYCGTCGATWDSTTIGLLAETVRAYNAAGRAAVDAARIRAKGTAA
jgi:hypothetical protein